MLFLQAMQPVQKFANLVPIPDAATIGLAQCGPDNGYGCDSGRGHIGLPCVN